MGSTFSCTAKEPGRVRFFDSSYLNGQIKRKPYQMKKIEEIILKLDGFQYATSLELSM